MTYKTYRSLSKAALNCISFNWDSSSDDNHVTGYVVFRNGWPIDMSVKNSYTDCRINPDGSYRYTVLSCDSLDRRSKQSLPLYVKSPTGKDNRIPLITDVHVTEITKNSATINWYTDELATTKVKYKIQYKKGTEAEYYDSSLTRKHVVKLIKLPQLSAIQRFEFRISSSDKSGNENIYSNKYFVTSKPGHDNVPPILNGIGAKRIEYGKILKFEIHADDQDRYDTIVYSVKNLPAGAKFDQETKEFSWMPDKNQIGIHRVIFKVNDGDQTDKEEVSIIVQASSDEDKCTL